MWPHCRDGALISPVMECVVTDYSPFASPLGSSPLLCQGLKVVNHTVNSAPSKKHKHLQARAPAFPSDHSADTV